MKIKYTFPFNVVKTTGNSVEVEMSTAGVELPEFEITQATGERLDRFVSDCGLDRSVACAVVDATVIAYQRALLERIVRVEVTG